MDGRPVVCCEVLVGCIGFGYAVGTGKVDDAVGVDVEGCTDLFPERVVLVERGGGHK